jgi:bombesin receptor subtype-3
MAGLVYVFDSWPWGDSEKGKLLCRATEFAKDLSIGVSIFTLVALATDRYTGIVNPLKKLQARSKMVLVIIAFTWFLAFLFALPSLIVSDVLTEPERETKKYCFPFGKYGDTYSK